MNLTLNVCRWILAVSCLPLWLTAYVANHLAKEANDKSYGSGTVSAWQCMSQANSDHMHLTVPQSSKFLGEGRSWDEQPLWGWFSHSVSRGSYTVRVRRYQLHLVSAFQAKSQSNICVVMLKAHGMHCWKARPFPGIPLKYRGRKARLLFLPRNSEHLYNH